MRRAAVLGILVLVVSGLLIRRSLQVLGRQRDYPSSQAARLERTSATEDISAVQTKSARLTRDQQSDQGWNRADSEGLVLPPGLQAAISANFPAYRIPDAKDITGYWTLDKKLGVASFVCRGDFNGDGLEDAAIILIDEHDWRFVIFEKDSEGKYRPGFVARAKTKEEEGKYGENEILTSPQQLLLRTVHKGDTWAPEAGDTWVNEPLKVDAIELTAKLRPNFSFTALVLHETGEYQQVFRDPLIELPAPTHP